tara:strand:- start:240 stop:959 length:720 start_codon:yes stop_codon:yes gene_type:complete
MLVAAIAAVTVLASAQAAFATRAALQELRGGSIIGPNTMTSESFAFASYVGAPGTLDSARLRIFVAGRLQSFNCDNPKLGIQGTCDTNNTSLKTEIDWMGFGGSNEIVRDFECFDPVCNYGRNSATGRRIDMTFTGAQAETLFGGPGPILMPDVVKTNFDFNVFCASGNCDIGVSALTFYDFFASLNYTYQQGGTVSGTTAPAGFIQANVYVPEPASLSLIGVGVLGAVIVAYRQRRAA